MRYWDEDQPGLGRGRTRLRGGVAGTAEMGRFTLAQVGWRPNATLVAGDVEAFVRRLKAEVEGEIDVAGPELAGCLTDLGLIDEYRLYFRPFVLGRGKPYFAAGARPPLSDFIAANPVKRGCGQAGVRPYLITLSRRPSAVGLASNRVIPPQMVIEELLETLCLVQ